MAHFPVWSECYMRIGELKCPILFFISGLSGAKNGRRHKRMDAPVKGRMWRVQVGKWLDSARDFPYWRHNTFLWTFSTEVYPVPYAFGNACCDADMLIASRGGVVLGCSRNSSHRSPPYLPSLGSVENPTRVQSFQLKSSPSLVLQAWLRRDCWSSTTLTGMFSQLRSLVC